TRRGVVNPVKFERRGFDDAGCRHDPHIIQSVDGAHGVTQQLFAIPLVATERYHCRQNYAHPRQPRLLVIVTATSSNGTVMGACGVCTVTVTDAAAGYSSTIAAIRSASVSMRSTGSRSIAATTCSARMP